MDARISRMKKKMIDYNIKPKDVKDYFGWSWTYNSDLMRGKADVSDSQFERVMNAIPVIAESKKKHNEAA